MNRTFNPRGAHGAPRALLLLLALLSLPTGTARLRAESAPAPPPAATVTLDAATRARLGIEVVPLAATRLEAASETFARVLDPASLAALVAELDLATASLAASRADAERTEVLYEEDRNASARQRDEARARVASDQARLDDARRRLALAWGEAIATLDASARSRLLADLVAGRAVLLRLELPADAPVARPARAWLEPAGDAGAPLPVTLLGALPGADPKLQTAGLLGRVQAPPAPLPVGRVLTARLATAARAEAGVLLPRESLVRRDGRLWVWIESAPGVFERRPVEGGRAVPDGWFAPRGFAPGESLVRAGAADLLAAERATAAPVQAPATDEDD